MLLMAFNKKIGYAVVGLGSIAKSSVLPAFARTRRAKLVAVVGRDKESAESVARQFRVRSAFASAQFADCLANPDIAAVYIATPQSEHLHLAEQAARAGKHVLCEKPLAATVAQAAKIVEVCGKAGVLLMTAYRKYFEASTAYMKKLIAEGALGRLQIMHTAFSELHVPGVSPEWLLDARIAGGGPLMDLGVYCVNTSRWLAGEDPESVSALTWRHDEQRFTSVEEGISFRMHFPSGLVVHGSASYSAAMSSFLFVQGTKGWLCLAPAFPFDEVRRLTGKIAGRHIAKSFQIVDEFAPEIDAFAEAIQEKSAVEPDGVQGLRDMYILRAIYEAAKKQKSVAIRYS
jgi:predicted dehydrogenase